jgi:Ser/Thr protein kinase RdoA (MazF antagonist)
MSLLQQAPRLSTADAERLARDLYGLEATARPLSSERDQNFLLTSVSVAGTSGLGTRGLGTGDGRLTSARYVLKIANAAEDRAMLEAQNAAMAHLARRAAICPHALPTRCGELIALVPGGVHFVRLVTYLEGIPFAEVGERTPALFESLGVAVGRLDAALADFDHPAIHRDFHWDLACADAVIREHLSRIRDDRERRLVERVSRAALQAIEKLESAFRSSAVHHDANDWNVVVSNSEVVGIIDFGDMVYSWTVADLAVAVAYALLGATDPLAVVDAVVRGCRRGRARVRERIFRRPARGTAPNAGLMLGRMRLNAGYRPRLRVRAAPASAGVRRVRFTGRCR